MNNVATYNNINVTKKKRISIFDILNYIFLTLLALICLFPVVYEILLSVSSKQDYLNATVMVLPFHFNVESYKYIFGQGRVLKALGISLLTTIVWNSILNAFNMLWCLCIY